MYEIDRNRKYTFYSTLKIYVKKMGRMCKKEETKTHLQYVKEMDHRFVFL
jgi:hypothetical protein